MAQKRRSKILWPLWFFLYVAFLWLVADMVTATEERTSGIIADKGRLIALTISVLMATVPEDLGLEEPPPPPRIIGHSSAHRPYSRVRLLV